MNRRFASILWCCLGLALLPGLAQAGAWPQPEDGGQASFTLNGYGARLQGYNRFGQAVGVGRERRLEGSVYWEHGVTNRLTFGLQPRLQASWMTQDGRASNNQGMAEAKVFARYTIHRGDWDAAAIQLQTALPGVAVRDQPRLAEANASYEIRALYGRGFSLPREMSGFVDLQAAFNYRAGVASDEMLYAITAGWRFYPGWMALAQGSTTIGLRNAGPGGADYAVRRVSVSMLVDLAAQWQLEVGYIKEVGGRHVSLGQSVIGALWYRY